MKTFVAAFALLAGGAAQTPDKPATDQPRLKTRDEIVEKPRTESGAAKPLWIVPAGTKIPIALRQPISTKDAKQGDPVYAQTVFPIAIDGDMVIPAGTWVQGVVDSVKRAGRIKGTAELQFHLTTLLYANGYSLDMAAAIDRVPGDASSHMKEPDVVKHDSEKGKDLERIGDAASKGGQIGTIAGLSTGSVRGIGAFGLSGIAAGTLIALLARGSDVRFDAGTSVEIALNHAIGIEPDKVRKPAAVPTQ